MPAEPLHLRVARLAARWGPGETVGLVVGATAPAELGLIRAVAPGLCFLVPGVGAQGGDIAAVMAAGPASAASSPRRPGGGLLVNVSRGISGAAKATEPARGDDPGQRVSAAAEEWAAALLCYPNRRPEALRQGSTTGLPTMPFIGNPVQRNSSSSS